MRWLLIGISRPVMHRCMAGASSSARYRITASCLRVVQKLFCTSVYTSCVWGCVLTMRCDVHHDADVHLYCTASLYRLRYPVESWELLLG